MIRMIDGFHQDDVGDWVAELSCLHGQHVRHDPPFQERPWVSSEAGRNERIGAALECPLCDRLEIPEDLEVVRTAGPFDAQTLPAALQRAHVVADHTWALLRVLEGTVGFVLDATPSGPLELSAGDRQSIPPGVPHAVLVGGPMRLEVDFLVKRRP
jgi:tellurite resistance-related uncharacterized protein